MICGHSQDNKFKKLSSHGHKKKRLHDLLEMRHAYYCHFKNKVNNGGN